MVINCNTEAVYTNYDESDSLYFEELSLETVLEICNFETPSGVIVSVGGQTPNNLAPQLVRHGVPILGTSATSIDMAADRPSSLRCVTGWVLTSQSGQSSQSSRTR